MPPNDAHAWMREGDRLLARGRMELGAYGQDGHPSRLPLARDHFTGAAQAYITGAVASQHGPDALWQATAGSHDLDDAIRRLDGRLRVEAQAALEEARRGARGADAIRAGDDLDGHQVRSSATIAEALRERLAYAAPELFNRVTTAELARAATAPRSR